MLRTRFVIEGDEHRWFLSRERRSIFAVRKAWLIPVSPMVGDSQAVIIQEDNHRQWTSVTINVLNKRHRSRIAVNEDQALPGYVSFISSVLFSCTIACNYMLSIYYAFIQIRLTTDLQVIVADHRFAHITWNDTTTEFLQYGEAGDCISSNCTSSKIGNFKMDIRHTGLYFVTPINWDQHGWPSTCGQHQPLNYIISDKKQVVSGNCGARCGGCRVEDLYLKIEEC